MNKERKYNKIDQLSRNKGGQANKGTSIFSKEYIGLSWQDRIKKAALKASDNGRCWWVYDYIMRTTIRTGIKPNLANHTGLAKELYPSYNK